MEALSGRGWFDAAVRDAHYSARKAFFLPPVCISKTMTFIDDTRNQEATTKFFVIDNIIERINFYRNISIILCYFKQHILF